VTRKALGGWLLRRAAASASLPMLVSQGGLEDFCVRDNYRSRLMRDGDLVFLWISGRNRSYERGIWATGRLQGPPGPEYRVSVLLSPLADRPLTDRALRSRGIDDLEVQRQPFGSNPSWISIEQLGRLVEFHAALGGPSALPWP